MRAYHAAFAAQLSAAPQQGAAFVWFLWVEAKDRTTGASTPLGFWSGDGDVSVVVPTPDGAASSARVYLGGCGLTHGGINLVGNLTDQPVKVSLSQIAPAAQQLVRGYDARHAYCELHSGQLAGGALISPPQLEFVGYVDEAPIATPATGGQGSIALSLRSELMHQLTATNPAKSSDAHQKRRQAGDMFSQYSGMIAARDMQWFNSK